jgi:hypothetical protein
MADPELKSALLWIPASLLSEPFGNLRWNGYFRLKPLYRTLFKEFDGYNDGFVCKEIFINKYIEDSYGLATSELEHN